MTTVPSVLPPARRFLVVHGVHHRRPRQHWLWWLTEALRQRGEQVLYPQFPAPERPSVSEWTDLLHAELAQLGDQERVVVCHSLGCALWLRAAQTLPAHLRVTRVLLVSPLGEGAFTEANGNGEFRLDRIDRVLLAAASTTPPHVVVSATDPCGPADPLAWVHRAQPDVRRPARRRPHHPRGRVRPVASRTRLVPGRADSHVRRCRTVIGHWTAPSWHPCDRSPGAPSLLAGSRRAAPPVEVAPVPDTIPRMRPPTGSRAQRPNPALDPLTPLLGDWRTTGTHPLVPGTTFHGRTSFAWHEGGAFVVMRSEIDEPGIPSGVAVIGSDDAAGTFTMLYFDERGVSRRYTVEVGDSEVSWHRDEAGFAQRMVLRAAGGGSRLEGRGTMSREGGPWEADLQLTYERVDP